MVDFNLIKKLINMVKDEGISGLTVEEGGVKIEVKREHGGVAPVQMPSAAPASASTMPKPAGEEEGVVAITSPMVGTFYRSPSPDSPPFVQEGDTIKTGQVVCIVEAMKLFNEIESEIGGKIVKILAENGKPVEYGQKLMLVKKS
ncbi:acetyl-CoA carboxylase biotin carboxyl carrier protein [Candidatus Saganbacteria bacterium]|nr:acetyl-CoA carboxylase biotin carboxyl carrier protein [Candidatus Saganbacteria bacterium]